MTKPYNFFAVVRIDGTHEVRRLDVDASLQAELTATFWEQAQALLNNELEQVPFDGRYRPDESELFYIPKFPIPAYLDRALRTPMAVPPLTKNAKNLLDHTAALIAARSGHPTASLVVQSFDRRRVIGRRTTLLLHGDMFNRLDESGLTIDDRAAAVVKDGTLYFRSYTHAKRVFDLTSYYSEATDAEIAAFRDHPRLSCEDPETFAALSDSWVRRKVASIQADGLLNSLPAATIAKAAKRYGLTVVVRKERVVLPADKKSLKDLLRVLDEDLYTGDLSQRRFLANSKRSVQ